MTSRTIEIDIAGTDKIKTLIELINRYADSLPVALIASLKDIADCDHYELGCDKINSMIARIDVATGNKSMCDSEFKLVADGEEIKHISSINPIVKSVTYTCYGDDNPKIKDDAIVLGKCYPSKMKMTYRDVVLAEW